jgi:hypothetical protein
VLSRLFSFKSLRPSTPLWPWWVFSESEIRRYSE